MKISRKDFLKGAAAGAASLAALGMTGALAAETPEASSLYVAGAYQAYAVGRNGLITVTVTVSSTSILDIAVTDAAETIGIGSKAVERMPGLILAAQSAEVDDIAGATITCNAIKSAAQEAIENAKAGVDAIIPEEEAAMEVAFVPGTYTATAEGYMGLTTLETKFSEDKILSVDILSCGDTAHICRYALDDVPDKIVERQSLRIEAVAGATYTSTAILNAVASCAAQAGCDPAVLRSVAVEKPQAADYVYDADVVVIGGGASGVAAAISASENGAKVILLEKSVYVGGCSFASSSNISAYNSKLQMENGIEEQGIKALYDSGVTCNHWHVNMPLFYKFVHATGETADWLYARGLMVTPNADNTTVALPKAYAERNESYVQMLRNGVEDKGGMVLYQAKVTDFLIGEDGAVCGVKAEGSRSEDTYTIYAKAVIICSGGWGGNFDISKQYSPAVNVANYAIDADIGEVTRIAWRKGAAKSWNLGTMQYHQFKSVVQPQHFAHPTTRKIARTISFMATALHVNSTGRRFRDETLVNSPQPGANSLVLQNGFYYVLVSQEMVDVFTEKGWSGLGITVQPANPTYNNSVIRELEEPWTDFQAVLDYMIERGGAFRGETLSDLAEEAGLHAETFRETVALYNEMCAKGEDSYIGKNPAYLIGYPENGPFYLVKCELGALGSTSGINIDDRFRVLNENHLPIKGLYAAGAEALGNILNDAYHFAAYANGFAFTSGRLSGMEAAQHVKA